MIDVVILILFLLLFYKSKLFNPIKKSFNDEYLSIDTSNALKGIFSIIVILHHLSQKVDINTTLFIRLKFIGFFAVAIFFFLSGYGLQKQLINKEGYNKKFLLKRLPSVLFPYILYTFIYYIMYYILGTKFSFSDIFTSIYHGNPIVDYSWYIISILLFYIFYSLLIKVFKKEYLLICIGCLVYNYLYIKLCIKLDFGNYWYFCTHLITIGVLLATYEKYIINFIKKFYLIIFPITLIIFILLFNKLSNILIYYIPMDKNQLLILIMLNALFFVILVLLILLKLKIGNKLTINLGKMSLELYLTQGILMNILRSKFITIDNNILYMIYTFIGTIIIAFIINKLDKFILKKYKKMIKI